MPGSTAHRNGDFAGLADIFLCGVGAHGQKITGQHKRRSAVVETRAYDGIVGIDAEPDDFARVGVRSRDEQLVICVEDQATGVTNGPADDPLDLQQLLKAPGAKITQVVLGDVRNQ